MQYVTKKVHFLHLQLPYISENAALVNGENGESLHQSIFKIENHYKSKWSPAMRVNILLDSS